MLRNRTVAVRREIVTTKVTKKPGNVIAGLVRSSKKNSRYSTSTALAKSRPLNVDALALV